MKYLILKASLLGILLAFLAVLTEQLLAGFFQYYQKQEIVLSIYRNFSWFLAAAVLIEEGFKYIAIQNILLIRQKLIARNIIVSSFFLGAFFGISEIGLILFSNPQIKILFQKYDPAAIFNLLSILLIQTGTAFLIGTMVAFRERRSFFSSVKILIFPVLAHLLYNFLIIQKGDFTPYLVVFALFIVYLMSFIIILSNFGKLKT